MVVTQLTVFPITLRAASEDDAEALIDIGVAACLSSVDQLPVFRDRKDEMPAVYADFVRRDIDKIILAETPGALLGYTCVDPESGEISDLWVAPDHQNKGIGALLLSAGEAAARSLGHARCWLTTHSENKKALRFYRMHGYALLSLEDAESESFPGLRYSRCVLGKHLSRPDAGDAGTMADVRQGIDVIDRVLMSLFAERFEFINRASQLKPALNIPARVDTRVEEVVENARAQANKIGFDPDLTETFWRMMIDLAIDREQAHFDAMAASPKATQNG